MKDPKNWTIEELREHLQRAVDVELYALPLYLCALYSIRDLDPRSKADYPDAARYLESVAIQEMLHLQLAANLCNVLGHTPTFRVPDYESGVLPVIAPTGLPAWLEGYRIGLGPVDIPQLKLFCTIEFPEPPETPDWGSHDRPHTLGEFYLALRQGIDAHWEVAVADGMPERQQVCFAEYLARNDRAIGFSERITSKAEALAAIDAIVAEGEGASGDEVPVEYIPVASPDEPDDPGCFDPRESHYQKCLHLLRIATGDEPGTLPPVYPVHARPDDEQAAAIAAAQAQLQAAFGKLLEMLAASFTKETTPDPASGLTNMAKGFWPAMFGMQAAIAAVWKAGAVPSLAGSKDA